MYKSFAASKTSKTSSTPSKIRNSTIAVLFLMRTSAINQLTFMNFDSKLVFFNTLWTNNARAVF